MNKEIKTKWLAALRSGKYEQGFGALKTPSGHCCLGVLCDVIDPTAWKRNCHRGRVQTPGEYVRSLLPSSFNFDILVEMNDENHDSFENIANYIDKNL